MKNQTKTVPIISIFTGGAEGTMVARLQSKTAASGVVIGRLRAGLGDKPSKEQLAELKEARTASRIAQSTIQVLVKQGYGGLT